MSSPRGNADPLLGLGSSVDDHGRAPIAGIRHAEPARGPAARSPDRRATPIYFTTCPCRKLELEHIDGVPRPKSAPKARGRLPDLARHWCVLVQRSSECEPRCSIFGTIEADDEGAVRLARPRGQDSPAG